MKKRIALLVVITAFLLGAGLASAQPQPQQQPPPQKPERQGQPPQPPDPFGDAMFPPEMIMQHARELNLTQEQKTFMREEINRTTTRFNDLQWQLQDAMEALHETMKANQVNEQQALAQLNKVLDAEREIKTLHMGMAIRIKNRLTPDQQMKLQSMRNTMMQPDDKRRERGPGGPDGPGRRPGRPDGPGGVGPGPGGPGGGGPRPGGRPGGPPNL